MAASEIVVVGGGFAGLWSALGAARKLNELGIGPERARVTLVNRDAFHAIRVRNYEADLSNVRVPLDEVLGPAGVRRVPGEVTAIDPARRTVEVRGAGGSRTLAYDRLVLAAGSQLVRPPIPGLAEHAHDVDTYGGAARLQEHLVGLANRDETPGRWTVLVVGAGLTGIEVATEMPARLRAIIENAGSRATPRVILADRSAHVGSDMGDSARPVIERALAALGVETRTGVTVEDVNALGVILADGERIDAVTIVWCAGMRASALAAQLGVPLDRFGRVAVDETLRVVGLEGVFAAGDVACARIDGHHASVMSCQHGRPMGRFAGHNVVSDLVGEPMLPLVIDWYVTVLDLGAWGAVYTQGWERRVVAEGAVAKRTKYTINHERIYPPRNGDRRAILDAAAPIVQRPPEYGRTREA
jgi:NADH dehydrogenase